MPELPEIEIVRRAIGPMIIGRRVTDVDAVQPRTIAHPDPGTFRDALVGRRFTDLVRRGKFLTAILDDGGRMVMHMRMTGCLLAVPSDRPEERHTRLVIAMDDGTELRFSDMRRFGRFWYFGDGEEDRITGIADLGPEPDDPALTPGYLEGRLGCSRRAVKECLLDQTVVAGIGNIYSDEILFAAGIDPACPACLLDHKDWERLAEEIPRTIGFFVDRNVVSPEEWMETDGKDYRNTPYIRIYGHAGEPCPVCGTTLVKRTVGGRGSVHCPMCQRERGC